MLPQRNKGAGVEISQFYAPIKKVIRSLIISHKQVIIISSFLATQKAETFTFVNLIWIFPQTPDFNNLVFTINLRGLSNSS